MAFTMDFVGDLTRILESYLRGLGYDLAGLNDEQIRMGYLNLRHRLVRPTPRNVHVASTFSCPPAQQAGLAMVRQKVEQGVDLRPHLSKGLLKIDYSDALLNDWGVYHLHLGTTTDASGFIARTGPVLFARFAQQDAYFIDVKVHGSWADQDVIRVVQREWPESVAQFQLKGFTGVVWPGGQPPSSAELAKLRNSGVQVIHELGGKVYAPFGGGYTTNRTSINVVRQNDDLVAYLRDAETQSATFEAQFRTAMISEGRSVPDPVPVHLERQDRTIVAVVGDRLGAMEIMDMEF